MKNFNLHQFTDTELFCFAYEMGKTVFFLEHDLADHRLISTPELEEDIQSAKAQVEQAQEMLGERAAKANESYSGLKEEARTTMRKRVFD